MAKMCWVEVIIYNEITWVKVQKKTKRKNVYICDIGLKTVEILKFGEFQKTFIHKRIIPD